MVKREKVIEAPENLSVDVICEGGNLDCGSGLLLLIRKHMDKVPPRGVLEIRSTEISVREDLPAWCRMTENPYLGWRKGDNTNLYFVRHGGDDSTREEDYEKARNYRWKCRVSWSEGMTSKVFCRNHSWEVGQPASFDVQDQAPSAVEYALGALGGCLAMGFQIHASRQNIDIEEIEISLQATIQNIFSFLGIKDEGEGHSGFKKIWGTLYVQSEADEEVLEKLWEETVMVSPMANSLINKAEVVIDMRTIL